MSEPTTIEFRFRLDDQSAAPEQAPPPRTEAPQYAKKRESLGQWAKSTFDIDLAEADASLAMWVDDKGEKKRPRARKSKAQAADESVEESKRQLDEQHERDGRATMVYREAQQAIRGLARGGYFASHSHFGLPGQVGAAGQFLEAGQSMARIAGFSEAGIATVAGPAGTAVAALGAFAMAVKTSSDALEGMASRASHFSADVSRAHAERNVKRSLFEMDQAERYGPQLAAQVNARTELGIEFDRMTNGFKMMFADLTTGFERGLGKLLSEINKDLGLKNEKDDSQHKVFEKFLADMGRHFEHQGKVFEGMSRLMGGGAPDAVQKWMDQPNLEMPADVARVNFQPPPISRKNTRPTSYRNNQAGLGPAALSGLGF